MKVAGDLGSVADSDLIGQQAVATAPDAVQRYRSLGMKQRDLPARVHARIGSRCTTDADLVLDECGEHFFEMLLHGRAIRLALPAVEAGAVVFDDQTNVPHGSVYQKCASMPTVPLCCPSLVLSWNSSAPS